LIVPNPDYRSNPKRAVFVQGEINRQLVQRLTPEIVRLQGEGRDPITVYIDSEGGKVFCAEALVRLLEASDQESARSCRIITVVTGFAASAAADLLCSGGYAMANAGCTIFFHGVRRSGDEITVAVASSMAESLRRTNERYAIALADKSIRRLGFRYAWMHSDLNAYRTRVGKQELTDVESFIGLLSERLSRGGLAIVKRAKERNERYEALVAHVARTARRSRTFQNPKRTADSEAVVIKSIIDFEKSKNKKDNWTYANGGLRQTTNDFLLVREYLNIYDGDHLKRLCDNWGVYFLSNADREELDGIQDENLRAERLHEKVKPLLRPLWLFFVALCYALQEEDNELSATDAFWLGLIDEVIGGPSDLFPFRLLIENVPDPAEPENP
jgi:ATP-dependent protease ClpP protease subunit